MNKYHRYINLPFSLEMPAKFKDSADSFICYMGEDVITKELSTWAANYNLKISNVIEGFYSKPNGGVPLHNDVPHKPGELDAVKLNFTWGPANSVTRWYHVNDEHLIEMIHDQNEVNEELKQAGIEPDIQCDKCYVADRDNATLVYEQVINKPSILNVGYLHDTHNPSEQHRWTLSFTLLNQDNSHLTFDKALEVFAECLSE